MGLFDKMQQVAKGAANELVGAAKNFANTSSQTITFDQLPETLEQMQALPQASLTNPFEVAALITCAFCVYSVDPNEGARMLNFLRGPKGPISDYDRSFYKDRFSQYPYVPFSYFEGAVPANDYRPNEPYKITFTTDPYTWQNEGYCRLNVRSGGADSPRQIQLRSKGDQWFMWEQFILVGIRTPKSDDPWA